MNTAKRCYLVTGAAGFLGSQICRQLLHAGCRVRGLVLPKDPAARFLPEDMEVVSGDLTDGASLDGFFAVPEGWKSVVIHCASMVSVDPAYSEKLMAVNVGGTRNIITQVLAHPECEKLVYVSSTGAIPEQPLGTKIREVDHFDPCDPAKVVGAYSQSKAKATQMVLDAVHVMGLNACVVHPSGILGPGDHALGETTRTLLQIIKGEMPLGLEGSFNLCDVRDLAAGTIAAVDAGRKGECYILANEPVTLKQLCQMIHEACDSRQIKFYLPLNLAGKIAQGMEKQAQKTGKKPLMTTFSVYNLARNNSFDDSKARQELGYTTRPYQQTILDEIQWMQEEGLLPRQAEPEHTTNAQIRESGVMADIVRAMEHDPAVTLAGLNAQPEEKGHLSVEECVTGAYKQIEHCAVDTYRKIEQSVVDAYRNVEQRFVDQFLSQDPSEDDQP